MAFTLPTEKSKPDNKDPESLLIYGPPKIGKTTIISQIEDNLIVDVENGSKYVEAMKLKASSPKEFKQILQAIKDEGNPYTFTTLDTITAVEEWAEKIATVKHKREEPGFDGAIQELAYGLGYAKIRKEFLNMYREFEDSAPHRIYIGHVKDNLIGKEGDMVKVEEINLTGQLKSIMMSNVDAIGYLKIDPEDNNKRILGFKTQDQITCGNRCPHLEGEEFIISEKTEDGVITHWDKIYTQL